MKENGLCHVVYAGEVMSRQVVKNLSLLKLLKKYESSF